MRIPSNYTMQFLVIFALSECSIIFFAYNYIVIYTKPYQLPSILYTVLVINCFYPA